MRLPTRLIITLIFSFFLTALSQAAEPEILSGTVISAQGAGKYTILQIKQDDQLLWLAAQNFTVAAGDRIEYLGGVPMTDFYVKSLDRKFENILFLTNIRIMVDKDPAKTTGSPVSEPMPQDSMHRSLAAGAGTAPPVAGEIVKAEAQLTVAELFKRRVELAGKVVGVRGKVLKVSKNIMGRTWVTLADGSGTPPDDVLRVTTRDEVKTGETVSAAGTVKIDVDLGAGYKYKVIVEEAVFDR